jgi:hypothetical protein
MFIIGLFDESLTLASLHSSDTHVKKMMVKTLKMKEDFIEMMNLAHVHEFINSFRPNDKVDILDGYGAAAKSLLPETSEIVDRPQLLEETNRLIAQVTKSDLPEYARKCLSLKLIAFSRIVQECTFFSDDELRRRIKSIYADYCAEFERNDKQHEAMREALGRWARKFMAGGIFTLALTADVSAVLPLLEGPK